MKKMKNIYHSDEETRKGHRAWKRYTESGYLDEDNLMIYNGVRNKVRKVTRYYQKCKEKEVADNARTIPRSFGGILI